MEIAEFLGHAAQNGDGYISLVMMYYIAQKLDKMIILMADTKCKYHNKNQ